MPMMVPPHVHLQEKSIENRRLIRVSVSGYVIVSIQLDDPDKRGSVLFCFRSFCRAHSSCVLWGHL